MADAVLLKRAVWLLRPFLAVDRASIRAFLTVNGEGWIEDPSNLNPRFERVRVRDQGTAGPSPSVENRLTFSQRAADFLTGTVVTTDGACFSLPLPAVDRALSEPAAWRGLLLLTAVVGGRVHVLETRSAMRLRAFLASGTLSRLTAGRVVFDRRRDALHLYRECRDIVPLVLSAGEAKTWDGRYHVSSKTGQAFVISARGALGKGSRGRHCGRAVPRPA